MQSWLPSQPYGGILCFATGWFAARWYRALDIVPPKIHPMAACIHGVASLAIAQLSSQADQSVYEVNTPLKAKIVEMNSWVFGVYVARLITNYLNLNYLKLDQVNGKTIPLEPISLRDSFLMEGAALSLYLLYSAVRYIASDSFTKDLVRLGHYLKGEDPAS